MSDDLQSAFEATHYRVFLDDDSHVLEIGALCPEPVTEWISRHAGARCAWLITGYNPDAQPIDDARNRARDRLLREWAHTRANAWLETVNEDPGRHWPNEPGVLLAGIEEGEVRATARRFGQAAIVVVPVAAAIQLIWPEIRGTDRPQT